MRSGPEDRESRLASGALLAASSVGRAAHAGPQDVPSFAREFPRFGPARRCFAFNGKDLTGFYTYLHDHKYEDPDQVFSVRDGLLRDLGQGARAG